MENLITTGIPPYHGCRKKYWIETQISNLISNTSTVVLLNNINELAFQLFQYIIVSPSNLNDLN